MTLNEILNGAYTGDGFDANFKPEYGTEAGENSMMLREYCLRNAMGIKTDGSYEEGWNIRNWSKPSNPEN